MKEKENLEKIIFLWKFSQRVKENSSFNSKHQPLLAGNEMESCCGKVYRKVLKI